MDKSTLTSLYVKNHEAIIVGSLRRSQASSELRALDVGRGLWELSYAARNKIIEFSSKEDRLHVAQAIPAVRFKYESLKKVDLSFRCIDGHLLLDLVRSAACQARHSRFPSSLDLLCEFKILREFSTIKVLDLSGASITAGGLCQLLALCPHLEELSLDGIYLTEKAFDLERPLLELKVVNLSNCAGLVDENCVIAFLATVPNLINLDLSNSGITSEAAMSLVLNINHKVEMLSFAELGQRFNEQHLEILASRCFELSKLDISSTSSAHNLQYTRFLGLPKLQELMANMVIGVTSLMTAEMLLGFQELPSLKKLYIHRRITNEELQRFAPWNLKFLAIRSKQYQLADNAAQVCREAIRDGDCEYPKMQLTNRMHFGGSDPM